MLVFLLGVSLAAELCNGVDDDRDGLVDEPAHGASPADCVTVFHDDDCDGAGRPGGATLCVCPGWLADPANPDARFDGTCWARTDADCDDDNGQIGPLATDGDLIDGRDNDCDGWILLAELDCDNDGAFPTTWTGAVRAPADLGLAPCGAPGHTVRLTCGVDVDAVCGDNGLFYVATAPLEALDLFENGRRIGRDANPNCSAYEDCDDTCALRCDGNVEVCDGIDNDCAGAAFYRDLDGIPDAMQRPVQPYGLVAPGEVDRDGDGVTDGCYEGLVVDAATIPVAPTCTPLTPFTSTEPEPVDTAVPPSTGCDTVDAPLPWCVVLLLGVRRRR